MYFPIRSFLCTNQNTKNAQQTKSEVYGTEQQ